MSVAFSAQVLFPKQDGVGSMTEGVVQPEEEPDDWIKVEVPRDSDDVDSASSSAPAASAASAAPASPKAPQEFKYGCATLYGEKVHPNPNCMCSSGKISDGRGFGYIRLCACVDDLRAPRGGQDLHVRQLRDARPGEYTCCLRSDCAWAGEIVGRVYSK